MERQIVLFLAEYVNILHEKNDYEKEINVLDIIIKLDSKNDEAYFKKGMLLFLKEKYQDAIIYFSNAIKINPNNKDYMIKYDECNNIIKTKNCESKVSNLPVTKKMYQWYQSQTHIMVDVMIKDIKKESTNINFQPNELKIDISTPNHNFTLNEKLYDEIIPEISTINYTTTKIEINMKKKNNIKWKTLEKTNHPQVTQNWDSTDKVNKHNYPSSSPIKKNWDELAKDVPEDIPGDGLQKLFQDMYKDATEDERRAMMKSYQESGGTALIANWNEVANKKVEIQPPPGVDVKLWNEKNNL